MTSILRIHKYIILFTVFFLPLIYFPYTSEIFEFNKMVFLYFVTIVLTTLWIINMVVQKKFLFRNTPVDIPLIIFLAAMTISTLFSIDTNTSIYGYYSRFNGGLLSYITYSFLYWNIVSNLTKVDIKKVLLAFLVGSTITSIFAILEHFNISFTCLSIGILNDKSNIFTTLFLNENISNNCWVQDVQNRVYSTFGQPNWLAAWLAAIIPLTFYFYTKSQKFAHKLFFTTLFFIYISALLFTKSRSGILALGVSFMIFWLYYFVSNNLKDQKAKLLNFAICAFIFLIAIVAIGTPWTQKITDLLSKSPSNSEVKSNAVIPALESGGTESGEIRKIVWQGAYDIWKAYPLFGSGLDTFAFSYYKYRPISHNNTSEWEYLYNKAHNEYLNFLATTGIVGILAYITLIFFMMLSIINLKDKRNDLLNIGLFAGFISLLITNFFGFSVVTTNFLFFLIPALAYINHINTDIESHSVKKLTNIQISSICFLTFLSFLSIYRLSNYWLSDYYYSKGKEANLYGNYKEGLEFLTKSVSISPNESLYWSELSATNTSIAALLLNEENAKAQGVKFADAAISSSKKALSISPYNVNLLRSQALTYVKLANYDASYLIEARNSLTKAASLAPTDPKVAYNLALAYLRTNDTQNALLYIKKSIDLKPDYKDARYAHAIISIDLKDYATAKDELEYILKYIDQNSIEAKNELEILNQQEK